MSSTLTRLIDDLQVDRVRTQRSCRKPVKRFLRTREDCVHLRRGGACLLSCRCIRFFGRGRNTALKPLVRLARRRRTIEHQQGSGVDRILPRILRDQSFWEKFDEKFDDLTPEQRGDVLHKRVKDEESAAGQPEPRAIQLIKRANSGSGSVWLIRFTQGTACGPMFNNR